MKFSKEKVLRFNSRVFEYFHDRYLECCDSNTMKLCHGQRELFSEKYGLSVRQVDRLGNHIRRMYGKLRLNSRFPSSVSNKIIELYYDGMSSVNIAYQLGYEVKRVENHIRNLKYSGRLSLALRSQNVSQKLRKFRND